MAFRSRSGTGLFRKSLVGFSVNPMFLTFLPAIGLAAYWFGVRGASVLLAALLPMVYVARTEFAATGGIRRRKKKASMPHKRFVELLDTARQETHQTGAQRLLICLAIEDFDHLAERHGQAAADQALRKINDRLHSSLRTEDAVAHLSAANFAICTTPLLRLDLELSIQLASRVQSALEEPIHVDGLGLYISASVGFCPSARAPGTSGQEWLNAAQSALTEARPFGSGAIRAFSDHMLRSDHHRDGLRQDVTKALASGEITAWFQPQISTDTGQITGFEALARWVHPEQGLIAPADFLSLVEEEDQLEHLADVMMRAAFTALQRWDQLGMKIPKVGVNFAGPELSNPRLVDKIRWELDRFDLSPDRLAVEVLETVVSNAQDDIIARNINALGALGCCVDLDDFGTGHASIASIKRFSVSRIKIDRSFVMKADRDLEQQRMISAILTMAEQLEIETVAEGVETAGEHALLAQLGCDQVQGFGIARPMPFDDTLPWIAAHQQKLAHVPRLMDGKGT
ncbi:MAG: GGDEF domain-containing phosphodiesterase [Pseudomonadota bacterium]